MGFSLYTIWIVLYLFMVLFCPPVLPFNSIYLLTIVALLWFGIQRRSHSTISFRLPTAVVFFLGYIVLIMLINSPFDDTALLRIRFLTIYQLFGLIPMQFICAKYVIESARERGYDNNHILKLVLAAGMIEVLFVIAAVTSPALRNRFLLSIIRRGGIERIYANDYVLGYRAYGWADTLLDTFGYGMGILAGLCLLYRQLGGIRYIGIVSFLFATAVNSRTGIAIFLFAVLVWIIHMFKQGNVSNFMKLLFMGFIVAIMFISAIELQIVDSSTISWITAGFESIWNGITGQDMIYRAGSLQNSMFTERFWRLPENIFNLIFGKGHAVFGTRSIIGIASDVGYVNYIWICGIAGTLLLLVIVFIWFRKIIIRTEDTDLKLVRIFLCVSFYIVFIKGNVLTHTVGTFLTIFLMLLSESEHCEDISQSWE